MIVTKQSGKNPDAANAYCRFVATSQMARQPLPWTGLIPSYLPNLENTEALEQHYPEYGGEQVWQTVVNLAKAMPPDFLYPAAYAEVWNAMTENWPAFYSGQAPNAWGQRCNSAQKALLLTIKARASGRQPGQALNHDARGRGAGGWAAHRPVSPCPSAARAYGATHARRPPVLVCLADPFHPRDQIQHRT